MLAALDKHMSGARWSHPEGGYFIWLELPDGVERQAGARARRGRHRRARHRLRRRPTTRFASPTASSRPTRSTRASHASPPRSSSRAADLRSALARARCTTENDLRGARGRRKRPRDQPAAGVGGRGRARPGGTSGTGGRAASAQRPLVTEVAVVAGELSLVACSSHENGSGVGEERLGILRRMPPADQGFARKENAHFPALSTEPVRSPFSPVAAKLPERATPVESSSQG